MAASFLTVCWLTSGPHAGICDHDAGHRWRLSSAGLLLTLGRAAVTLTTVLPRFAFCFCFTLNHMPTVCWNPGLPPCLLFLFYYMWYSEWAELHLGRHQIQSTLSFLLRCEKRDHSAACCWPLDHSEGDVSVVTTVYACNAWLLMVQRVFPRKRWGVFYKPLRKLQIIFAGVWSIDAISQVSNVLLLL